MWSIHMIWFKNRDYSRKILRDQNLKFENFIGTKKYSIKIEDIY